MAVCALISHRTVMWRVLTFGLVTPFLNVMLFCSIHHGVIASISSAL